MQKLFFLCQTLRSKVCKLILKQILEDSLSLKQIIFNEKGPVKKTSSEISFLKEKFCLQKKILSQETLHKKIL